MNNFASPAAQQFSSSAGYFTKIESSPAWGTLQMVVDTTGAAVSAISLRNWDFIYNKHLLQLLQS
jgi:hypothetical protein